MKSIEIFTHSKHKSFTTIPSLYNSSPQSLVNHSCFSSQMFFQPLTIPMATMSYGGDITYLDIDDAAYYLVEQQLSSCHLGSKENFPIDLLDTVYEDPVSSSPPFTIDSSEVDEFYYERNFASYLNNFSCPVKSSVTEAENTPLKSSVTEGEHIFIKPLKISPDASLDSDSDSEDNAPVRRSVAEGENIVAKPMYSYIFTLKEKYHLKNAVERRAFFVSFLERAVGRFASEALNDVGLCGEFAAFLTKDELRKLSGMEEVAQIHKVRPRLVLC